MENVQLFRSRCWMHFGFFLGAPCGTVSCRRAYGTCISCSCNTGGIRGAAPPPSCLLSLARTTSAIPPCRSFPRASSTSYQAQCPQLEFASSATSWRRLAAPAAAVHLTARKHASPTSVLHPARYLGPQRLTGCECAGLIDPQVVLQAGRSRTQGVLVPAPHEIRSRHV